jgi:hypothetical protein
LDTDIQGATPSLFDRKQSDVAWNLLYYHPSRLTASSP